MESNNSESVVGMINSDEMTIEDREFYERCLVEFGQSMAGREN